MKKIKVHVVDDSASVRAVLTQILNSDPHIEVIDTSLDPIIAQHKLEKQWPDVFILDIEMPRMDGIAFLKQIMSTHPTPVVMCSSLTEKNAKITIEAMQAGAVEAIEKPKVGIKDFLTESAEKLIDAVKSAAEANMDIVKSATETKLERPKLISGKAVSPKLTADVMLAPAAGKKVKVNADKFIAIGASAGGTVAIEKILSVLPATTLGIVIVQHMPEKFTNAFAERLNEQSEMNVLEAKDGDKVKPGTVYIAPGDTHLMIQRKGSNYFIILKDGPRVSRHKPSVDVLFRSVAKDAGENVLGIILTGMGDDGAVGMLEMKQSGIKTIAQNKETCIVFGMPKEAIQRGGVDEILPLSEIPEQIINWQ